MTRQDVHSLFFVLLISLVSLMQCATPISPTGGPVDSEPPVLVKTDPANESTAFKGDKVSIEFNEYLNVASFSKAFEITPEIEDGYELKWKGKKLNIQFKGALRDSTTYIINIDKSLKDLHGVALPRPISFAFSTGDQIDAGRLAGEILDPKTGKGVTNMDVLAFGLNTDGEPSQKALYRTQVDDKGFFALSYLPNVEFRLIGIVDNNRNRMVDAKEMIAISEKASYIASSDSSKVLKVMLWKGRRDDASPKLLRVRPESPRDFTLEFSETVEIEQALSEGWLLRDSLASTLAATEDDQLEIEAFRSFAKPNQLLFHTEDSLITAHLLDIISLRDSVGNTLDTLGVLIKPSQKKLTKPEFLGFRASGPSYKQDSVIVLYPGSRPAISHSSYIDSEMLSAQLDSSIIETKLWDRSPDGMLFLSKSAGEIQNDLSIFSVPGTVFGVDTSYVAYYRDLAESETGSISGYVDYDQEWILEFYQTQWGDGPLQRLRSDTMPFVAEVLPKGSYSLRAIKDLDQNGRWTPGAFNPFQSPEPLQWVRDSLQVQSRFETVMDTLRW